MAGVQTKAVLALALCLGGCVTAQLPERDFRPAYAKTWSKDVVGTPGGPFVVYDLEKERRLMVRQSFGASLRDGLSTPSLLGLSSGKPPFDAMAEAAKAYLSQNGRGTCELYDPAKEPGTHVFEFRYRC